MGKIKMVRLGLIGLGNMGKNHLRILSMLKNVEIVFISDLDEKLLSELGEAYGIKTSIDPESLLNHVDAVIICTPTVTHGTYIKVVSAYVQNIFVEKPLAATLREGQDIAYFTSSAGINVQVGFIERFNPAVQSLRTVLDRTERLISLDFTRTNKVSSRITDVDVVTDLMIHDIDLALYLNGPAKSVVAHGFATQNDIDFASALVTHVNGKFSRIQASRITDKKIRKIEGTCTDMFVDCDLLRKEILINRQAHEQSGAEIPYTITAIQEAVAVKPQEALLTELQSFISNCQKFGSVGVPDVNAGVEALKICDAIRNQIGVSLQPGSGEKL